MSIPNETKGPEQALYEAEIEPLIVQAKNLCEKHGLAFVCSVAFDCNNDNGNRAIFSNWERKLGHPHVIGTAAMILDDDGPGSVGEFCVHAAIRRGLAK